MCSFFRRTLPFGFLIRIGIVYGILGDVRIQLYLVALARIVKQGSKEREHPKNDYCGGINPQHWPEPWMVDVNAHPEDSNHWDHARNDHRNTERQKKAICQIFFIREFHG